MTAAVNIARCAVHGLHGERSTCFVCGGPVEQAPMVPAAERDRYWQALVDIAGHENWQSETTGDIARAALGDADRTEITGACEPHAHPVDGGWGGYRAACHRCEITGPAVESKDAARDEAFRLASGCCGPQESSRGVGSARQSSCCHAGITLAVDGRGQIGLERRLYSVCENCGEPCDQVAA